MAGKLQNEDFKTEAQITGAGGSKSQLLNDTKIYVTADGINKTLDDAIVDGDIGSGGGGIATVNMTDWESFAPAWTNDTGLSATVTAFKRRVGDSLELYVQYLPGGTGTDNATLRMTLPDSLVIDTNKATADQGTSCLGHGYIDDGNRKAIGVLYRNTTSIEFYDLTTLLNGTDPVLGDELGSGDTLVFRATIPIDGWDAVTDQFISGTDNVAPSKVTQIDSTSIPAATKYFIGFDTISYDDDSNFLGVGQSSSATHTSTTRYVVPSNGYYRVRGHIFFASASIADGLNGQFDIVVNGTTDISGDIWKSWNTVSATPYMRGTVDSTDFYNAGDIINLSFRYSGAALTPNNGTDYGQFEVFPMSKSPVVGLGNEVAYVKEVLAGNAGATTADTIHTRQLNTLEGDTSFISLNANQVTIQPGKYSIEGDAPCFSVGRFCNYLYNVSDVNYDITGGSGYSDPSGSQNRSLLMGTVNFTTAKTFELRTWTQLAKASNGLGLNMNNGSNPTQSGTFGQLAIRKLK